MLSCCTARAAGWFIHGNVQVWNNNAYNATELVLAKAALIEGNGVPDGCDPDLWTAAKNYLIFVYCLPAAFCCIRLPSFVPKMLPVFLPSPDALGSFSRRGTLALQSCRDASGLRAAGVPRACNGSSTGT